MKETKPATQQPPATKKTTMKRKSTTTERTTSPSYDFGDDSDELSDETTSCSVEGEYFNDEKNCAGYRITSLKHFHDLDYNSKFNLLSDTIGATMDRVSIRRERDN